MLYDGNFVLANFGVRFWPTRLILSSRFPVIDGWKLTMSKNRKVYCRFSDMLLNHSMTVCALFHSFTQVRLWMVLLIRSKMILLIFPRLLLAGLTNLPIVFSKFSLWSSNREKKIYIGITANDFKKRYRNHQQSFPNGKYGNETELSKYVWKLKGNNRNLHLKLPILGRTIAYQSWATKCNLFGKEVAAGESRQGLLLNKRSEIVSKCHTRTK